MPINTPQFRVFDYGSAVNAGQANAMNRHRLQQARDPNSVPNQMNNIRLQTAQQNLANAQNPNQRQYASRPAAPIQLYEFEQNLLSQPNGKAKAKHFREIARKLPPMKWLKLGDRMQGRHAVSGEILFDEPIALAPDKKIPYIEESATTQRQAISDVDAVMRPEIAKQTAIAEADVDLVTKPLLASSIKKAEMAAERGSPEALAKKEDELFEANNMLLVIDGLMGDGVTPPPLRYAYGKEKAVTPELLQSQDWIDAGTQRDQIVATLKLAAAGKIKGQGQVTDAERTMLAQAATILGNPMISLPLAMREMKKVREYFQRISDRKNADVQSGETMQTEVNLSDLSDEELKALRENTVNQ